MAYVFISILGLGYLSLYSMAAAAGRMVETITAAGKRQFNHYFGGKDTFFMMLPVDMALWWYGNSNVFFNCNILYFIFIRCTAVPCLCYEEFVCATSNSFVLRGIRLCYEEFVCAG